MAENDLMELHKQHRTGQDKYIYFLLAVAASGIAYAVEKTAGFKLSWTMVPLGAAVLLWGASFFFGCRTLHWIQTAIGANYSLVQLHKGVHTTQPDNPEAARDAINGVQSALDYNAKKAQFYGYWQFPLLVLGAGCFVAWRIVEMIARTYWQ